jgi:formylglycine-generating enzyme required for sulfatase activity
MAEKPQELIQHTYCYYSFETLDPENPDPSLRTFVRCTHCGRNYHEKYWNELKCCLFCNHSATTPINGIAPLLKQPPVKKKPMQVQPASRIWLVKKSQDPRVQIPLMVFSLIFFTALVFFSVKIYKGFENYTQQAATASARQTAVANQQAQTEAARPTPIPFLTFTPFMTATADATSTSTPLPGSTQVSPIDGMLMVYIDQGEFTMGSDNGAPGEKPSHKVGLDSYWIDRAEVTNAMYALCVQAGACQPPSSKSSLSNPSYYDNINLAKYPVINVSWNDASTYCTWAGRRLPTEAEWEKAGRGLDGRIYPWGNFPPSCSLVNYSGCTGDTTAVGIYPSGTSPYGMVDMAGNVWEWVNDWYDATYYVHSPQQNPQGPASGNGHVVRGGGFQSKWIDIQVFHRANQNDGSSGTGFRCVISIN